LTRFLTICTYTGTFATLLLLPPSLLPPLPPSFRPSGRGRERESKEEEQEQEQEKKINRRGIAKPDHPFLRNSTFGIHPTNCSKKT
jgi:hypothetical protein